MIFIQSRGDKNDQVLGNCRQLKRALLLFFQQFLKTEVRIKDHRKYLVLCSKHQCCFGEGQLNVFVQIRWLLIYHHSSLESSETSNIWVSETSKDVIYSAGSTGLERHIHTEQYIAGIVGRGNNAVLDELAEQQHVRRNQSRAQSRSPRDATVKITGGRPALSITTKNIGQTQTL